ncbi:MAG: radical SAM protein [Candidatus Thorarchaeota archaeon]|nr:MAG: radical SAM protein [Candidatus Thorarchaeota archaeon]
MNAEDLLRLKVRLLTEGVILPEGESTGRRGGAGPVGSRYFTLPNGCPCGIPVRQGRFAERFGSRPLVPTKNPAIWLHDGAAHLKAVQRPKFYDLSTADGIPYQKLALLHGNGTLATTVYQSCRYWNKGEQCKFCTIPLSHSAGDTVLEKTPDQIAEVVDAAEREGVITSVLLTTGTPSGSDMGCERLIGIVKRIHELSTIPVGVQFEPSVDETLILRLADAGAKAVGIHIESADESIREKICPGKFKQGSPELYRKSWECALSQFARGNVSTFILHGLGEDIETTLGLVRETSEMGVMPVVTPVRPAPGSQLADFTPDYVGNLEETMAFYMRVGEILQRHHLNPKKTAAGCHRCGGCTPIQEAFDWAQKRH